MCGETRRDAGPICQYIDYTRIHTHASAHARSQTCINRMCSELRAHVRPFQWWLGKHRLLPVPHWVSVFYPPLNYTHTCTHVSHNIALCCCPPLPSPPPYPLVLFDLGIDEKKNTEKDAQLGFACKKVCVFVSGGTCATHCRPSGTCRAHTRTDTHTHIF